MEDNKKIIDQIREILFKHFGALPRVYNASDEIFNLIYDLPEDKVIVVDSKLRKREVEGGVMYNFQTDGTWDIEWHWTPKIHE
jgi:hypothetical protein